MGSYQRLAASLMVLACWLSCFKVEVTSSVCFDKGESMKEPNVILGALAEVVKAIIPTLIIFGFIHWSSEQVEIGRAHV